MLETLVISETPKAVMDFAANLDDLLSGRQEVVTLPQAIAGRQFNSKQVNRKNLGQYIEEVTSNLTIFVDVKLNGVAGQFLTEVSNLRLKEKKVTRKVELVNFGFALNDLLSGRQEVVTLPQAIAGRQFNSKQVNRKNLGQYIMDINDAIQIFVDSDSNQEARVFLDNVNTLQLKESRVLETKSKKEVFLFAQSLGDLLSGRQEVVTLPQAIAGRQFNSKQVNRKNLDQYIVEINGGIQIFIDSDSNKEASEVLNEVAILRRKEKTLTPEELQFINATKSVESLEAQIEIRTSNDVQRKELILDFARTKRRILIKLEILGLLGQDTVVSGEEFRAKIEPLQTPDVEDRKIITELGLKYSQILTENFCKLSVKKISAYSIGTRRLLIEETQRLLGTGLIKNGNQAKLAELLDLAVSQQQRFFENELARLVESKNLSMRAIDELVAQFDTFNVEDLNYKADLRRRAADILRGENEVKVIGQFRLQNAEKIVELINNLPNEYPEDEQLRNDLIAEFKRFLELRKDSRIADYNFIFKNEITLIKKEGAEDYEIRDVGLNYEGAKITRANFKERLMPLLQVLEGDKEAMIRIAAALSPESRQRYVIDIEQLQKQRNLTPIEEAWFKSAEITSFTTPYLVGLVNADREITLQHLEYLFAKISRETQEKLNQIQYYPSLVVGLGPNGMAGLAEMRRLQPALLDGTLVIDQARNPAGPFGVPESAAFNLNSQAPRLTDRPQLPNAPNYDESKSIQGYVSPLQALPGQRTEGEKVIRGLSINQTDPALIADKDVASDIYPSNEDLEIVVKLQAALTVKNLALSTRMVKVEKNTTGLPGTKLVTLEITAQDGSKRLTQVTTDLLITATGLGEPDPGFETKNTRSEKVIAASLQQTESIPKATTTLDGFRGLGGRFEEEPGMGLGRTIGIGGKGNSFDTLAEKIVGKFVPAQAREQAKKIRDTIGKIYVFAPNAPKNAREYLESQRSRYATLADFIDRGDGKGDGERLITFIDTRITDFDFADSNSNVPTKDRQLIVFGSDKNPIKNQYGEVIKLDNLFLTTGFKSIQDKIFQPYQQQNGQETFEKKPLTLSSAPRIQVGEELPYDPDTIFIGTGSAFASSQQLQDDKLLDIAKVSPEAADALLRVGAKNLVAVGVKSRDAVAAINDFLWKRRDKIKGLLETFYAQKLDETTPPARLEFSESKAAKQARLSNHLSTEQKELFAAGVIATELGRTIFKEPGSDSPMNRDFIFELTLNPDSQKKNDVAPLKVSVRKLLQGSSASAEKPLLNNQLMGVYANELISQTEVVGQPSRITRATNVRTGEFLGSNADIGVPAEILNAFTEPHFIKTIANILPFSDVEKIRVRVSIRQGTVLPQRTQVKMVNEF